MTEAASADTAKASGSPEAAGPFERGRRLRLALAVAGAAALCAVPLALNPFQVGLAALALSYGLFAFGLDIAWGRAGIVSIGHAVFFGLGAYGAALAETRAVWLGWGWLGGIGAAVAIALLLGAAGLRRASNPSVMAVLTLGVSLLVERIAVTWTSVTGGSNGLFVMPPDDNVSYYYVVLGSIAAVTLGLKVLLLDRRFGNRLAAIRINERLALHLGIPIFSARVAAFALSAGVAAFAGALAAPLMSAITPDRVGVMLSTQALVWVAVGGRGTLAGPILGAAVAVYGQDLMAGTLGSLYLLILGIMFVLCVLYMPRGLVGLLDLGPQVAPTRPGRARAGGQADRQGSRLSIEGLTVDIGGNRIIEDLSLAVEPAEIVCLIGPNGAGKSTLLHALSGMLTARAGSIRLGDTELRHLPPDRRAAQGLARTFQVPNLFPGLTVAEHFILARQEGSEAAVLPARYRRLETVNGHRLVDELSLGDRRLLEIAMAVCASPRVILLDEPAAGLPRQDSSLLVRDLRDIRDETGCTIICVEHDMDMVRDLADRVVCLHRGRIIAAGSMDAVSADPNVRKSYLGNI